MSNTVFLQKNSKFYLSSKVDVILACELYWVRVFDIPIDSHKEVLEVLPSFFDDFFDVKDYKYFAIKLDKHKYLCFAYNENEIVKTIKNSGLEFKNINNIYFSQNELVNSFENKSFYEINKKVYCKQDDIIVSIPENIAKNINKNPFDINKINLSKHKIYINQSSKYIDVKTAYILSSIFIIFSIIIFSKTMYINRDSNNFENKIDTLKSTYNLPSSMIQTKSILSEYKSVKRKYDKFRIALKYILGYKVVSSAKLIETSYKANEIIIKCENKNKTQIENYISKKYKILSSSLYGNNLQIRIKI